MKSYEQSFVRKNLVKKKKKSVIFELKVTITFFIFVFRGNNNTKKLNSEEEKPQFWDVKSKFWGKNLNCEMLQEWVPNLVCAIKELHLPFLFLFFFFVVKTSFHRTGICLFHCPGWVCGITLAQPMVCMWGGAISVTWLMADRDSILTLTAMTIYAVLFQCFTLDL